MFTKPAYGLRETAAEPNNINNPLSQPRPEQSERLKLRNHAGGLQGDGARNHAGVDSPEANVGSVRKYRVLSRYCSEDPGSPGNLISG